jgi:hypothetical protein
MAHTQNTNEEERDDSSSGTGGGVGEPPALVFEFPFEAKDGFELEKESVLIDGFWHDGSFAKLHWWGTYVKWGRWTYDTKQKVLKHALTQRTFRLAGLDSQERLLRAMTSLLVQPNADVEHFYQLATGVLKHRHGVNWDAFWGRGEQVLQTSLPPPSMQHTPHMQKKGSKG